ncbi:MAG: hypothetical protein ACN6PF_10735 [Achromobacter veterisilvae]
MTKLRRATIQTELCTEIQCSQCKEFWPADGDFFFLSKGTPHSWCKACFQSHPNIGERKKRWRDKQRAARAAQKNNDQPNQIEEK